MEAISVYGDNLMRFLRESGSLGRFERSLHMLNPKQVKKFRDAYSNLPKNDHVDSYVIADHLRFGRINKEVYMDDYKYQALKMYTRARHQLVQELTQEKIFSDKFGATSTALIEEFSSLDELAYMSTDELVDFIRKKGKIILTIRKELQKLFSVLRRILIVRRRSLQTPPSRCSPYL